MGVQMPPQRFGPLLGGAVRGGQGAAEFVPVEDGSRGNSLPAGQESDLVQKFFLLALAQP